MKIIQSLNRSGSNVFVSGVNSPKISNAFEIFLLDQRLNHPNLFIRRSTPTVVMGVNQNPWIECDVNEIKRRGVELMRRSTGGGTVYLDEGNLLVGFLGNLTKNPQLSKKVNNQIIIDSIKDTFNVDADSSGRNDVVVGDKKVAGSAFRYEKTNGDDYILHHLSILVNADLDVLQRYLTPDKRKLDAKGVKSVRSRVENLIKFNSLASIDQFKESIIANFINRHQINDVNYVEVDGPMMLEIPEVKKVYDQLNSESWIYGNTPIFTHKLDKRFDWGTIYIFLNVDNAIITDVNCNTDSLFVGIPGTLKELLIGTKYDKTGILNRFDEKISDETNTDMIHMLNDIKMLFKNDL